MQTATEKACTLQHVLLRSEDVAEGTPVIIGHDFNSGRALDDIMGSMITSGFQATNLGEAIAIVNEMVRHAPPLFGAVLRGHGPQMCTSTCIQSAAATSSSATPAPTGSMHPTAVTYSIDFGSERASNASFRSRRACSQEARPATASKG